MSGEQSRLSKVGAERLLDAIDTALLFDAFVDAARTVLRLDATNADDAVVDRAADIGRWSPELLAAVRSKDDLALTAVAIALCELRVFGVELRSVGEQR